MDAVAFDVSSKSLRTIVVLLERLCGISPQSVLMCGLLRFSHVCVQTRAPQPEHPFSDTHMSSSSTLDTAMHDLSQLSLKRQRSTEDRPTHLTRTRRHESEIEECIRQLYQHMVLGARECTPLSHAQQVVTLQDGTTVTFDLYVEAVQGHYPLVHSRLVQPSEHYSGPRTVLPVRVKFCRDGVIVLQGYAGFSAPRPVTWEELLASA